MANTANRVQVVRECDTMPGNDFVHFMFAVAVERCPLDTQRSMFRVAIAGGRRPVEDRLYQDERQILAMF